MTHHNIGNNTPTKKNILITTNYTFRYKILGSRSKHLQEFKEKEAKENKDTILNAIRELGNASTSEVYNFLDKITQEKNQHVIKEAQTRYERGIGTSADKEKYIRKNTVTTIGIRTIQRCVKELKEKEGLLEKRGDQYYLSQKALSDKKYFPKAFGEIALMKIGVLYANSIEQSLIDFVSRFGAFIVYTFIEAALSSEDESMSIINKHKVFQPWLQNAIPLEAMSDLFYSLYGLNKPRKEQSDKKIIKKLAKIFGKRYPDIYGKFQNIELEPFKNYAFSHVVSANFMSQLRSKEQ